MGNLESLGDAITGGLLGRAVEPKAGEAGAALPDHDCLNCGSALTGPYCAQCGQRAHVHRSVASFFHDLVHGVFHFEGKVWHTLPLLAWKPGELTRRYIDGQRARFVSPIALFLFCVFLLFAVGGVTKTNMFEPTAPAERKADMAKEVTKDKVKLGELEKLRAAAKKSGQPTAAYDEKIQDLRAETATISVLNGEKVKEPVEIDSRNSPRWLGTAIKTARENPDLVLYKLKTNAYKYSWMLIPLSVPFLWLLFPFSRRFHLYDHTVFVTYSLCFMSMLAIAWMILGWVGLASIAGILAFIPPVHMYRQLKGAYDLSTLGALWRASVLTIFAFIAGGLFVTIIAGIGFAA